MTETINAEAIRAEVAQCIGDRLIADGRVSTFGIERVIDGRDQATAGEIMFLRVVVNLKDGQVIGGTISVPIDPEMVVDAYADGLAKGIRKAIDAKQVKH